jgi:polysaccharide biosynthesis protein PelA
VIAKPRFWLFWLIHSLLIMFLWPSLELGAQETEIPRTILAIYSARLGEDQKWSQIHQFAEMPLNHLGLKLRYHNIEAGIPKISANDPIRGVITWFASGTRLENPEAYLRWARDVVQSGKKFVILGDPGFFTNKQDRPTSKIQINRFLRLLGLRDTDEWISHTYDLESVFKNAEVVEFERRYSILNSPFERIIPISDSVTSHLIVRKASQPDKQSHLVITSRQGGYIADGFAMFKKSTGDVEIRQWYVNPFAFFRLAFNADELPKPDTTTLAGRRIYYSHIDGDGWLNRTLIEEFKKKKQLSSQVVLEQLITPYPDLPVTVTAVVAELDPDWAGTPESQAVARALFSLPQVEIGSHTYSHPFDWSFFADGNPEKEIDYLHKYPNGGWKKSSFNIRLKSLLQKKEKAHTHYNESNKIDQFYSIPRAYASRPFDLNLEIAGAVSYLNGLAPQNKSTQVVMWTGDTTPFKAAVRKARQTGLYNINGGDSRFDREYRSYAWVSPIGRVLDDEIQVYASNSNENTYTDLWQGRFHGFRFLIHTVENTDRPIRVKPFNLYYHMYSGERRASLNAVISNLEYALKQEIIPIRTSHYCAVANGFYTSQVKKIGDQKWRIENRGKLQTIRFDHSSQKSVDFKNSIGVIGQRHFQGSLYVFLDDTQLKPVIKIKPLKRFGEVASGSQPYLVQSRWMVSELQKHATGFRFRASGFGRPEMVWRVAGDRPYQVRVTGKSPPFTALYEVSSRNNILRIHLPRWNQGDGLFEISQSSD